MTECGMRAGTWIPLPHWRESTRGRWCLAAFVLAWWTGVVSAADLADHPGVRANQLVGERWLFTHPSWLRWWLLPNFEQFPDQPRLITGVFCVFVESASGNDSVVHRADVEARCRALGIDFVFGVRHAHFRGQVARVPFDPEFHRNEVRRFLKTGTRSWMIDSEPYYSGARRYNNALEAARLFEATEPWKHLGRGRLFIQPAGPEYYQFHAIAAHAAAGGTDVFALDSRTYNASRRKDVVAYMRGRDADHRKRAFGYGVTYVPGMFIEYAVDERLMKHVAETYGRCWFFGRTSRSHFDDQPRFGRPDWKWLLKLPSESSGAK